MELSQKVSTSCSSINKFPLHPQSQDQNFQLEESATDENNVYQQLLQVVSTCVEYKEFDSISPDIINRHDQSQGATPLHYACISANLPMITYILENGGDVDIWDKKKRVTPLACAASQGHLEVVKVLLEKKCNNVNADFQSSTTGQYSALYWAAKGNHQRVFSYILEDYISKNPNSPFRDKPAAAAVMCGSPEILQMLIITSQDDITDCKMGLEENSPLHLAASGKYKHSMELCKILVEDAMAKVDSVNGEGKTPLHLAAQSRNVDILNLLLSKDANANAEDEGGRTPLFYAISGDEMGALDCMKALVQKGNCDVNHQDKRGYSPLHLAGNYAAPNIAEFLLLNGADFSIRTHGGASALSSLHKNIPTTPSILKKTFNQAVTLSSNIQGESQTGHLQDIEVDFSYVIPSPTSKHGKSASTSKLQNDKLFRITTMPAILKTMEENKQQALSMRKETSKVKCLIEEGYSDIMVHPVVHSFLELKWQKVEFFYSMKLAFKTILVILFSAFMQIPYIPYEDDSEEKPEKTLLSSFDDTGNHTTNATKLSEIANSTSEDDVIKLHLLEGLYVIIAIMATINALVELMEIFRAPKHQLKTLHPWISAAVWLMIYYHSPTTWREACDPDKKPLVALGILLAWIDIWADMSRLPKKGLSIRVFLRVFKNFSIFMLPHCCLLLGFILSLSLVFYQNNEFQSPILALTKLIRVAAGDITMISDGVMNKTLRANTSFDKVFYHQLIIYIYTAYVLVVAIVLMNLLIGLAANDLQDIFKGAAVDKLVKQTILLNTLETSFSGHWTRSCLPRGIFSKYINLFPPHGSSDKTITFNQYAHDSHGPILSPELNKELLSIGTANKDAHLKQDDEQQTMKDYYEKLKPIMLYFESRMSKQQE